MPQSDHTAVIGLQWGDEGKGKIVDLLAREHDAVVRYNGGANAGHTIVLGDERYALHLIPSGIFDPEILCVIGNGVVADPAQVLKECAGLRERGIKVGDNLRISSRAHVVMPWHQALDGALENLLTRDAGEEKSIGTTRRGIGPAYADKVTRASAVRMGDLLDEDRLRDRLDIITPIKNAQLLAFDPKAECFDAGELTTQFADYGRQLAPHICDTTYLLHDLIGEKKRLLFEGANACLLDIDHGTFPYVTSSNCSALGIPAGTGVPAQHLGRTVGIVKAYATRVGTGPFPTELHDDIGNRLRDRGHEYGTTTGRPRRCGWLDLVAVRYSAMLSGATELSIMLFDILAGFDELLICTAYEVNGERTERFLPDGTDLKGARPIYETMPGFADEITEARAIDDLPVTARAYLDRIAEFVGLPIRYISVGPERTQTIVLD